MTTAVTIAMPVVTNDEMRFTGVPFTIDEDVDGDVPLYPG